MGIGFIGVGDMASYMVHGLCRGSGGGDIVLSPRGAAQAAALAAAHGCRIAANNAAVVADCDMVVLAVRPADVAAVLAGLPWRAGQVLVSVVAGATLADLAAAAPAVAVRSMPVSAAAIGESPTAIYPDHPAARALLERLGTVTVLPDEGVFAAASVMGAYHGWVFGAIAAAAEWLEGEGIPPDPSRALAAGMMRAAAGVALADRDTPLADTLARLTTPGGITEAGFQRMDQVAGRAAWPAACAAALALMEEG